MEREKTSLRTHSITRVAQYCCSTVVARRLGVTQPQLPVTFTGKFALVCVFPGKFVDGEEMMPFHAISISPSLVIDTRFGWKE